jgi:low affinity Fe/Cu permease
MADNSKLDGLGKDPSAFTKVAQVTALDRQTGQPFSLHWGSSSFGVYRDHYSGFNDTWQLVINTSTTMITFLMVFIIQNSQNRDTAAMQIKLDELLRRSRAQGKS